METQARVGDLLDLEGCSGGVATALAQEGKSYFPVVGIFLCHFDSIVLFP